MEPMILANIMSAVRLSEPLLACLSRDYRKTKRGETMGPRIAFMNGTEP